MSGWQEERSSFRTALSLKGLIARSLKCEKGKPAVMLRGIMPDGKFNCGEEILNRDYINKVYKKSAGELLKFNERQNVSSDMKGLRAAAVVEGRETHTRTGFLEIKENTAKVPAIKVPVTHAKIFGCYDNEFGSYVYCLGNLLSSFPPTAYSGAMSTA